MFNLERYIDKRKVETLAWNSPYQLCKGLKIKAEGMKWEPGSYFKIVPNGTQKKPQ